MKIWNKLLLLLALGVCSPVYGGEPMHKKYPFGYYGAGHLITETSIKTTQAVMGNYEVVPYNQLFSSTLAMLIAVQYESDQNNTPEQKVRNLGAFGLGILTGNLFQLRW